ncbi:hypothetical protein BH10ACT10_BH10ACT10_07780 [soil metagenome]
MLTTSARQRFTAVAIAAAAALGTLAGCSSGEAGAYAAPLEFNRVMLGALDSGGHAPYRTSTKYAAPGDTVSVGPRRLPPCSTWARTPYASDRQVVATADGFAAEGNRQVYRAITVYSSTRAARLWIKQFMARGIGCTSVAGAKVAQTFGVRPAASPPDIPVDKILTRYDGWAGAVTTTGVTPSLGSSWSIVARRKAQVTLTTVYVPDVGADYAAIDPATQSVLLAYVADKNAPLVRAAFSGRPALH